MKLASAGLLVVLTAFGGAFYFFNGGAEGLDENPSKVDKTVEVRASNYDFDSDRIEVESGERIRFVLESDEGTHNMKLGRGNVIGTGNVSEGESDSFTTTFQREGTYQFECTIEDHAERGMTIEVNVS